jgi:hypothetical protein
LVVLSADYPESVDRETIPDLARRPIPCTLSWHVAHPEGERCEWVEGGRCKADGTYLGAHDFWKAHGDPAQREQPESFWLALEAELSEREASQS